LRALVLVLLLAAPAFAQQDGAAVFDGYCASCHSLVQGGPRMAGPPLAGLMGRAVGSVPGFGYSSVLAEAGRAGDRWTAERLREFLDGPEDMYPGLWMGGTRLRDAAGKNALAAYLAR
jgi:cytochrome c